MKRALLFLSFLVLNYGILSADEQITITTYYPSPYGSYDSLQADKFGVGDNNGDGSLTSADVPTTSGDVWIKDKVGIGTITPANKLQIGDITDGSTGFQFAAQSNIGYNMYLRTTSAANAAEVFHISSSSLGDLFRVNNNGNVGIGIINPGYQLTLAGRGAASVFAVDNGNAFLAKNSAGTYEGYFWPRWTDNIMYTNFGSGGWNIRNSSSTNVMFMTNGGAVGIGTTAPRNDIGWAGALDVNGQIRGTRYYDDDINYYADLNSGGRLGGNWRFVGGSLVVSPGDNNNFFSVNNDYNVGIELRSGSSGGTPYIDFSNDASSDYDGRIILNGSVLQIENPSVHDVLLLKSPNATIDLYVDSPSGNSLGVYSTTAGAHARISASDFRLISDIRLKKNVETLTGVLGRLDAVRGVSFDLIKGDDKRSIGVIAQELETVFPELVTKSKNGKDGLTDERFVSYGGLSAVNLQGLKELKAVVLAQAEEIKALKQRLDVLEKK